VISITAAGTTCLLLEARSPWAGWFWAYTASFSAHLAIIGVSYLLFEDPGTRRRRVGRWIAAGAMGWALVAGPVALAAWLGLAPPAGPWVTALAMPAITLLAGATFHRLMPRLYGRPGSAFRVHATGALLASLAAALAAGTLHLAP